MRRLVPALALLLGVAACGSSVAHVSVPAMLPAAESTWPKPPVFPESSCWTRDTGGGAEAYAPQYLSEGRGSSSAKVILKRLLRSFGDRSLILSASLGPRPPVTRMHTGYFPNNTPPADAVWLYLRAPATIEGPREVSPNAQLADWEVSLFAGGLRDALCLAGSRPLLGWSTVGGHGAAGFSDDYQPFGQRFPNPTPTAFRRRVATVARAYGLRVVSVRFLRPFQLAPIVVLEAKDRKAFSGEAANLQALLDPRRGQALTFEGFFLEVRDAKGPFIRLAQALRGQAMGSQWTWDPCYLPYDHSEPVSAKPCPKGTPGGG